MLIQETETELSPAEVVGRAKDFFLSRLTPYTGFLEDEGDGYVRFSMEAGEVLIGATAADRGRTRVRASTSRAHHEVSQFLATLAPPEEIRQNLLGPGVSGAG